MEEVCSVHRRLVLAPGDYGLRSAFDVVPTLLELCGVRASGVSGEGLLPAFAAAETQPQGAAPLAW